MEEQANRLAHLLRGLGIGPEQRVAICMERSVEMMVAVMGILKAGGAYLPMEPADPVDRLSFMLQDSNANLMITNVDAPGFPRSVDQDPDFFTLPVRRLDFRDMSLADYPATCPPNRSLSANLAYIIYTSGSTGKPKGVLVTHASPINLLRGLEALVFKDDGPLRITMNAPLSFDASMQQIIMLTKGHHLHIIPQQTRLRGADFLAYLDTHALHAMDCTPAHLEALVEAGLLESKGKLPRYVLVAGGAIHQELWDRLAKAERTQFFDIYGPTECTVDATGCLIDRPEVIPSIGPPLANYRIYLHNRFGLPVPYGAPGQIHIGGAGLARGYLARPALTAEKFVPDPHAITPGSRLYASGDLARFHRKERLEFISRMDNQIKLRGFRIEPGEIEAALLALDNIRDVVVIHMLGHLGETDHG